MRALSFLIIYGCDSCNQGKNQANGSPWGSASDTVSSLHIFAWFTAAADKPSKHHRFSRKITKVIHIDLQIHVSLPPRALLLQQLNPKPSYSS